MNESINPCSQEASSPDNRRPFGAKRSRLYFGSIGLRRSLLKTQRILSSQPGYEGINLEFGVTKLDTEPLTGSAPYAEFRWAHTRTSGAEIGFAVVVLAHQPRNKVVVSGEPVTILPANATSEIIKAVADSLKHPQLGIFKTYPEPETPPGS